MNLLFIRYIFSFNPVRFLPGRRYTSAGLRQQRLSVRLSVRHEPVVCKNEES